MSFDLGKKLVMGGFGLALISSFSQFLSLASVYTVINILAALTVAAGFAMMWYMGGNILHLGVAGAYALGFVLSLFLSGLPAILSAIIFNVYLLIWAFKRFSDGDMMGAIIIGGIYTITVVLSPALSFLYNMGRIDLKLVSIISLIFSLGIGGGKIFAAMSESEK